MVVPGVTREFCLVAGKELASSEQLVEENDSSESRDDSITSDSQVLYKVHETPPICLTWLLALQVSEFQQHHGTAIIGALP